MQNLIGCSALNMSQDNICPYIIRDKGYFLLPWFMILHKQNANVQCTPLDAFYNKQLSKGKNVVENEEGMRNEKKNKLTRKK